MLDDLVAAHQLKKKQALAKQQALINKRPTKSAITQAQAEVVQVIQQKYYDDCGAFVRKYFPALAESPKTKWQMEEFKKFGALRDVNRYAYVGCTGSGKSTLIVLTCIWLCMTRNDPRIVIITSTGKQTETTIFDAIREYIKKSSFQDFFETGVGQVTLICNGNKIKHFCFGDEHDDKGNALRGLHSTDAERGITAVCLDEANNFGEWVYAKLSGIMADGNSLLLLSSNGGPAKGGFYLRFTNKAYGFNSRRVTAWDIGMSQERINAIAANLGGVESEAYQHLICAQFTGGDISAITLAEMEASKKRYAADTTPMSVHLADQNIVMGVDLSGKTRGRSKNCVCIRNSHRILFWELYDLEAQDIFRVLDRLMKEYNVKYCYYDASGVLGALFRAVAYKNQRIMPFRPQDQCMKSSIFLNRRSEVIFRMIQWITLGNGCVPFDDKLCALFGALEQLIQSSDVKFGTVGRSKGGKLRYSSKDELEKHGDKTTMDKFDALSYTFANDRSNVADAVFQIHSDIESKNINTMAWRSNRGAVKGMDPLKYF